MFIYHIPFKIWQNHWTVKTLQDMRQNYWLVTYIYLRSNFRSYWLIIREYGVYTWNTLQRQNHWTVKTLWDIRQNYWTLKCHADPSLQDLQVNVTRLTNVWPSICLKCFHNRKVEKKWIQSMQLFKHFAKKWSRERAVTPIIIGGFYPKLNLTDILWLYTCV